MKLLENMNIGPRLLVGLCVVLATTLISVANKQPTVATATRDRGTHPIIKQRLFKDWATVVRNAGCTNEWCAPWKDSRLKRAESNLSVYKGEG